MSVPKAYSLTLVTLLASGKQKRNQKKLSDFKVLKNFNPFSETVVNGTIGSMIPLILSLHVQKDTRSFEKWIKYPLDMSIFEKDVWKKTLVHETFEYISSVLIIYSPIIVQKNNLRT